MFLLMFKTRRRKTFLSQLFQKTDQLINNENPDHYYFSLLRFFAAAA